MARTRKGRARRDTGTIVQRGDRFIAQVDFGVRAGGRRDRRTRTFETHAEAQDWLLDARQRQEELTAGVADQRPRRSRPLVAREKALGSACDDLARWPIP